MTTGADAVRAEREARVRSLPTGDVHLVDEDARVMTGRIELKDGWVKIHEAKRVGLDAESATADFVYPAHRVALIVMGCGVCGPRSS